MRAVIAIAMSIACSRPFELEPGPKTLDSRAPDARSEKVRDQPPELAPWFLSALTWPKATEAPLLSAHMGTPHIAEIHVNPEALEAYRNLVGDTLFAEGTWFVERLRHADTGRSGPILALERTPKEWRFWVLDPQGRLDPEVSLDFCAGCHAGALAPPVFGLPRQFADSPSRLPQE
jgi:hypothetical protein